MYIFVVILVSLASSDARAGLPLRHALVVLDGSALARGIGSDVDAQTDQIALDPARDGFPRRGSWTWPETQTEAFIELLPSWNVTTPPDTGVRVSARVRDAETGTWSPWLDFGYRGRVPPPRDVEDFDGGRVDVDILTLDRPADAYQVRADFFSFRLDEDAPSLRRLAVVTSRHAEPTGRATTRTTWSGVLDVPFVPQADAGGRIGSSVCSPTSVTMACRYYGRDASLMDNIAAIYDDEHAIFGNWNRAAARAGELGLSAVVDRFDDLGQARATLAAGTPIIASVRFKRGEAPSFVMDETAGHLIVLRDVTPAGDFVVNDPASRERGEAAIYKAADLHRAWIDNAGGVAYVLREEQEERATPPPPAATSP